MMRVALFLLACCAERPTALAARPPPRRVLVTGAGGETGSRVLRLLESKPERFAAVGLVRTAESRAALPAASEVVVASVTDPDAVGGCMKGVDCLIICTSAKPAPTGETSPEGRPFSASRTASPRRSTGSGRRRRSTRPSPRACSTSPSAAAWAARTRRTC